MNLVLVESSEIGTDGRVSVRGARADHLRNVLMAAPGQDVRIGVLDGAVGVGTVTSVAADVVELQCVLETRAPERPRVDMLLALPRPKVMRRLWAQLAALGVGQVILTNADKVERDYFDSHVLREDGYRPLLIEGLAQARDTRVPVVSIHKRLTVLVEDRLDRIFPDGRRIVAHPGSDTSIAAALGRDPRGRVLLAIGPEGGWNDFELQLLERHGFERAGMGSRTLATTTACIALLALVHEAIGRG